MCRHSNIAAMSTMVPRYVLPTNVVPVHYGLAITPNIAAFTFKGAVDIVFQANSDNLLANGTANQAPAANDKCLVDHVTLNSAEITITKVSFTLPNDPGTPLFTITGDDIAQHVITEEKDDRVRIELPKKEAPLSLCVGDAFIVSIEYDGIINDKMHGFYRSGYTKETTAADGTVTKEDCFMGTTQFEAADARRALPCYDEPSHKASFALSIAVPKAHFVDERYRVLANTHESSREDITGDDGVERVRVTFGTTPKMSTYLLAWTIGHFDVIERTIPKLHPHPAHEDLPIGVSTSDSTVVRIFAPPQDNKIAAGEFALDVACKVIPLYEKFMGSNYILDKCDLLAIPDFAAGAMENWGLITYRETALLYDPKRSSATSKQWVALVVAHELAHQWFGNLVTMQWWKELWLNESFATFVEYWAVDTLFPDWNIFTQFVNDEGSAAFSLDALNSSHPVEVDVEYAAQIDEIFDAISYSKGGSVLRMVVEYIGWEAFGNGLKKYLADFSFSNASTEDLWRYLGEAAGQPELAELLRVWTSVQGYPMLTVSPSTSDKSAVNVSQKRFFADSASEDVENATWNLPLKYLNNGTTHRALITTKVADLPCEKADAFVKVNSNGAAFCRVKYQGGELLEKLIAGIKNGEVTNNIDRLTLISDYAAFAQGGYISAAEVISAILPAFSTEEDYTVWCAISKFESAVRSTLFAGVSASDADDATEEQKALSAYNALCVNLYGGSAFKKLGIVPPADGGEDHRLSQLRALLVARLCSAKDASTISAVLDTYWAPVMAAFAAGADAEAATKAAGEYLHNKVPADLQQCVLSTAVLSDPSETGNYTIVKSLCKDSDASFRSRCLRALGSTTNPKLLAQTGTFAVVSGEVRSQDSFYALVGVAANNMGSPDGSAIPPAATAYVSALLIAEWATVMKKFPGMMSGRIVKFIEYLPPVEAVVQLLEVDFWEKTVPEADKASVGRSFQQGLEAFKQRVAWKKRDGQAVFNVLLKK